jgi:hypothetical protein
MAKKDSFSKQFKGGYYPQEHVDQGNPLNGHEVDSPSTVRKRQGVARGFQAQANPGMAGKADYSRKRRK